MPIALAENAAGLKDTFAYFQQGDDKMKRSEWLELSDDAKAQIRNGLGNGSETY